MKTTLLGITAAVLTVTGLFLVPAYAQAYKGDPKVTGPNYTTERHAAMEKAFEQNDYEAWKKLMSGKGRVIEVINKDNFAQFAKAHKLADAGNAAEANKIRQELGLGLQNGSGKGQGRNAR